MSTPTGLSAGDARSAPAHGTAGHTSRAVIPPVDRAAALAAGPPGIGSLID